MRITSTKLQTPTRQRQTETKTETKSASLTFGDGVDIQRLTQVNQTGQVIAGALAGLLAQNPSDAAVLNGLGSAVVGGITGTVTGYRAGSHQNAEVGYTGLGAVVNTFSTAGLGTIVGGIGYGTVGAIRGAAAMAVANAVGLGPIGQAICGGIAAKLHF